MEEEIIPTLNDSSSSSTSKTNLTPADFVSISKSNTQKVSSHRRPTVAQQRSRLGRTQAFKLRCLAEYKLLPTYIPSGIYVLPHLTNDYEWCGVMFVKNGPYRGGIFKFLLRFPSTYPAKPPQVSFHQPIPVKRKKIKFFFNYSFKIITKMFLVSSLY